MAVIRFLDFVKSFRLYTLIHIYSCYIHILLASYQISVRDLLLLYSCLVMCVGLCQVYISLEKYLSYVKERESVEITSDLSFTLQSEEIVLPKDFKEIPSLHLGKRDFKTLTIETYYQGKVLLQCGLSCLPIKKCVLG